MLALADQPFIDSQIINRLIDEFDTHNKGIVVPVYKGRSGHPVIFDLKYKDELLALGSQGQAREIKHRHPEDVLRVTVDSKKIIFDIDTAQDYEQAWGIDDSQRKLV
jgi:molybdenum cofactor cytidylyltransferase